MALATDFDGLLIDLDGVVWVGGELLPGAAQALRELLEGGCQLVFVTNNPAKPPAFYAQRLRDAGVEVDDRHVVTAGVVTARLARERAGNAATAFVIGATAFKEEVGAAGLELVEAGERDAAVVLVSGHRGFDYEELLTATRMLQRGAALLATSRDPTLPMPDGAWPGTGSILAAVETASGANAEIGGKPERHLFEQALERIPDAERVAMVGDRLASDIEGGRQAARPPRRKQRKRTRRPTTSSTTSPACCYEAQRGRPRPAKRPASP
jgi:HAD superfamily hydrolase (TIGR01450 family)